MSPNACDSAKSMSKANPSPPKPLTLGKLIPDSELLIKSDGCSQTPKDSDLMQAGGDSPIKPVAEAMISRTVSDKWKKV